jgi:hypothetical protein
MKVRKIQQTAKAVLCGAVFVTACLFGSPARAQAGFQGKFTLPYEVHWGRATLPAGDYVINYIGPEMPVFLIRDAHSLRPIALERAVIREDCASGNSALLIGTRGTERVVHSLRIAELGQVIVYDRSLANRRAVEEARQTQAVPVVVAEK